MKSYKEYERQFIGDSDIAALIFVGTTKDGLKANILNFGSDGRYNAYVVDEIVKMTVQENTYLTSNSFRMTEQRDIFLRESVQRRKASYCSGNMRTDKIRVYRAGDFGCIIQLIGEKE